jgi:aryl-alcohol dehydrogenase-like predicted oxidoreductase
MLGLCTPDAGGSMPLQQDRTPSGLTSKHWSPLAFGMWRMATEDLNAALATVDAALEAGMTVFDTADIYGLGTPIGFGGAEALLGRVLRARPQLREEIVLATKGGITPPVPYDSSAAYLVRACEASLTRLGVESIDLYQIHRPDLLTHPAELAGALERLVRDGKVRAVGVSNTTVAQTRALLAHLTVPLASLQPEYSPLYLAPLEDGTLDLAMEHGLAVLAWSPLGGGRLMGEGSSERERAVISVLNRLAGEYGVSRAAVTLAWVRAHPSHPVPIVGTQSPERLRALRAAHTLTLTPSQWYEVLVAARGAPMP